MIDVGHPYIVWDLIFALLHFIILQIKLAHIFHLISFVVANFLHLTVRRGIHSDFIDGHMSMVGA